MGLTPNQVVLIKATVPVLQEHGETITKEFYSTIISENPSLNNVFSTTNQVTGAQPRALAHSLFAYATYIDNLGVLSSTIETIVQKHVSLNIQPAQYDVVGQYLLAAMGKILGAALTPDLLNAWAAAYGQLAAVLIGKEGAIYESYGNWTSWRDFKVIAKTPESSSITSFHLAPADGLALPAFRPGQYISIQIPIPSLGYLQARQYSLSDTSNGSSYRISVKRIGTVSSQLHDGVQVGDTVSLTHPAGEFVLKDTESPAVLISAGVGLTPVMAMLNARKGASKTAWFHGTRSTAEQAFAEHVRKVEGLNGTVFVSRVAEGDVLGQDYQYEGRLDLEKVDPKALFVGEGAEYYVCGPGSFMADVKQSLMRKGVDERNISMELFATGEVFQSRL